MYRLYNKKTAYDFKGLFSSMFSQIRVNAVNPTLVLTKMTLDAGFGDPVKAQPILDWIPLKRLAGDYHLSLIMRKPAFCICENKDADQLRGNREADQRLCFRYTDSTIHLLPKSEKLSL